MWQGIAPDKQKRQQFANYSAFMAGLLKAVAVDATRLSVLTHAIFLRTDPRKPKVEPAVYEAWLAAGAQWLLVAGAELFEMCSRQVHPPGRSVAWTNAHWDNWRLKFEIAAQRQMEYGNETRGLAARVMHEMIAIERAGVTTNVVAALDMSLSGPEAED